MINYIVSEKEFIAELEKIKKAEKLRPWHVYKVPDHMIPVEFFETKKEARQWFLEQEQMGDPVRIITGKDIMHKKMAEAKNAV